MKEWLKTFALPPDEYTCREFRPEDGELEGILIENPIVGGTMEKDGQPVAYAGINYISGRHWVFFYIRDQWSVAAVGRARPYYLVEPNGATHKNARGATVYFKHYESALEASKTLNRQCSVRRYGLWIFRTVMDALRACKKSGIKELYGLCDTTKPQAREFMVKLGFKQMSVYEKPMDALIYEKLMGGQAKTWIRVEGDT